MSEPLLDQQCAVTVTGSLPLHLVTSVLPFEKLIFDQTRKFKPCQELGTENLQNASIKLDNLAKLRANPWGNLANLRCRADDESLHVEMRRLARNNVKGTTLVLDTTLPEDGRNMLGLRHLSEVTGIRIIATAGFLSGTRDFTNMEGDQYDTFIKSVVDELVDGVVVRNEPSDDSVIRGPTEHVRAGAIGILHLGMHNSSDI